MKKSFTYKQQLEILSKSYLTCEDICNLLPIGKKQAYKLMQEIEKDMEADGIPNFIQRPKLVPTRYVVDKLKLDIKYIKRQ